jgi:hypothetical protein
VKWIALLKAALAMIRPVPSAAVTQAPVNWKGGGFSLSRHRQLQKGMIDQKMGGITMGEKMS